MHLTVNVCKTTISCRFLSKLGGCPCCLSFLNLADSLSSQDHVIFLSFVLLRVFKDSFSPLIFEISLDWHCVAFNFHMIERTLTYDEELLHHAVKKADSFFEGDWHGVVSKEINCMHRRSDGHSRNLFVQLDLNVDILVFEIKSNNSFLSCQLLVPKQTANSKYVSIDQLSLFSGTVSPVSFKEAVAWVSGKSCNLRASCIISARGQLTIVCCEHSPLVFVEGTLAKWVNTLGSLSSLPTG